MTDSVTSREKDGAQNAVERAETLLDVGRWQEAVAVLRAASALHPDHSNILAMLARAYWVGQRPDLVLAITDKEIGRDPNEAWPYFLRAMVLVELGRPAPALQAALTSVRLEPDSEFSHYAMVHALLANGGTRRILSARHHADLTLRLAPAT